MTENNFLCDRCRHIMCQDCLDIADEYAELLRNARSQLSTYAATVPDLLRQLNEANKQVEHWEWVAKLGYPEVMKRWMDSLEKERAEMEGK